LFPNHFLKSYNMKKIIIFFISFFAINLNAQYYYNKIIPFEFGNPTASSLLFKDNKYLMPVIYYSDTSDVSTLIVTNENSTNYYHYNYFVFAHKSLVNINNQLFAFAKDRSLKKDLRLAKLNSDFDTIWEKSYETNGEWNFPASIIHLDNYIFIAFIVDFNNGKHREFGIKKIDTLGNEIWSKNYNLEDKLTYVWEISPTLDKNILISTGVVYNNIFGRYSQLTKIDTSGNIIWRTKGEEPFDFSSPAWTAQLSDSSIVLSYRVHIRDDSDFIKNKWSLYPIRLKWFNKYGKPTYEKYVTFSSGDEMYFNQIESGKGNYFFAYGMKSEFKSKRKYYGSLIKYANTGDTIWQKKYQFNGLDSVDVGFDIRDIEELENGDIIALGVIIKVGERQKIWLFKVNSEGCFGEGKCGEYQRTNIKEFAIGSIELTIYPNPTPNVITINLPKVGQWKHWGIYDFSGKQIKNGKINNQNSLTISNLLNLTNGIYILKIFKRDGNCGIGKFTINK